MTDINNKNRDTKLLKNKIPSQILSNSSSFQSIGQLQVAPSSVAKREPNNSEDSSARGWSHSDTSRITKNKSMVGLQGQQQLTQQERYNLYPALKYRDYVSNNGFIRFANQRTTYLDPKMVSAHSSNASQQLSKLNNDETRTAHRKSQGNLVTPSRAAVFKKSLSMLKLDANSCLHSEQYLRPGTTTSTVTTSTFSISKTATSSLRQRSNKREKTQGSSMTEQQWQAFSPSAVGSDDLSSLVSCKGSKPYFLSSRSDFNKEQKTFQVEKNKQHGLEDGMLLGDQQSQPQRPATVGNPKFFMSKTRFRTGGFSGNYQQQARLIVTAPEKAGRDKGVRKILNDNNYTNSNQILKTHEILPLHSQQSPLKWASPDNPVDEEPISEAQYDDNSILVQDTKNGDIIPQIHDPLKSITSSNNNNSYGQNNPTLQQSLSIPTLSLLQRRSHFGVKSILNPDQLSHYERMYSKNSFIQQFDPFKPDHWKFQTTEDIERYYAILDRHHEEAANEQDNNNLIHNYKDDTNQEEYFLDINGKVTNYTRAHTQKTNVRMNYENRLKFARQLLEIGQTIKKAPGMTSMHGLLKFLLDKDRIEGSLKELIDQKKKKNKIGKELLDGQKEGQVKLEIASAMGVQNVGYSPEQMKQQNKWKKTQRGSVQMEQVNENLKEKGTSIMVRYSQQIVEGIPVKVINEDNNHMRKSKNEDIEDKQLIGTDEEYGKEVADVLENSLKEISSYNDILKDFKQNFLEHEERGLNLKNQQIQLKQPYLQSPQGNKAHGQSSTKINGTAVIGSITQQSSPIQLPQGAILKTAPIKDIHLKATQISNNILPFEDTQNKLDESIFEEGGIGNIANNAKNTHSPRTTQIHIYNMSEKNQQSFPAELRVYSREDEYIKRVIEGILQINEKSLQKSSSISLADIAEVERIIQQRQSILKQLKTVIIDSLNHILTIKKNEAITKQQEKQLNRQRRDQQVQIINQDEAKIQNKSAVMGINKPQKRIKTEPSTKPYSYRDSLGYNDYVQLLPTNQIKKNKKRDQQSPSLKSIPTQVFITSYFKNDKKKQNTRGERHPNEEQMKKSKEQHEQMLNEEGEEDDNGTQQDNINTKTKQVNMLDSYSNHQNLRELLDLQAKIDFFNANGTYPEVAEQKQPKIIAGTNDIKSLNNLIQEDEEESFKEDNGSSQVEDSHENNEIVGDVNNNNNNNNAKIELTKKIQNNRNKSNKRKQNQQNFNRIAQSQPEIDGTIPGMAIIDDMRFHSVPGSFYLNSQEVIQIDENENEGNEKLEYYFNTQQSNGITKSTSQQRFQIMQRKSQLEVQNNNNNNKNSNSYHNYDDTISIQVSQHRKISEPSQILSEDQENMNNNNSHNLHGVSMTSLLVSDNEINTKPFQHGSSQYSSQELLRIQKNALLSAMKQTDIGQQREQSGMLQIPSSNKLNITNGLDISMRSSRSSQQNIESPSITKLKDIEESKLQMMKDQIERMALNNINQGNDTSQLAGRGGSNSKNASNTKIKAALIAQSNYSDQLKHAELSFISQRNEGIIDAFEKDTKVFSKKAIITHHETSSNLVSTNQAAEQVKKEQAAIGGKTINGQDKQIQEQQQNDKQLQSMPSLQRSKSSFNNNDSNMNKTVGLSAQKSSGYNKSQPIIAEEIIEDDEGQIKQQFSQQVIASKDSNNNNKSAGKGVRVDVLKNNLKKLGNKMGSAMKINKGRLKGNEEEQKNKDEISQQQQQQQQSDSDDDTDEEQSQQSASPSRKLKNAMSLFAPGQQLSSSNTGNTSDKKNLQLDKHMMKKSNSSSIALNNSDKLRRKVNIIKSLGKTFTPKNIGNNSPGSRTNKSSNNSLRYQASIDEKGQKNRIDPAQVFPDIVQLVEEKFQPRGNMLVTGLGIASLGKAVKEAIIELDSQAMLKKEQGVFNTNNSNNKHSLTRNSSQVLASPTGSSKSIRIDQYYVISGEQSPDPINYNQISNHSSSQQLQSQTFQSAMASQLQLQSKKSSPAAKSSKQINSKPSTLTAFQKQQQLRAAQIQEQLKKYEFSEGMPIPLKRQILSDLLTLLIDNADIYEDENFNLILFKQIKAEMEFINQSETEMIEEMLYKKSPLLELIYIIKGMKLIEINAQKEQLEKEKNQAQNQQHDDDVKMPQQLKHEKLIFSDNIAVPIKKQSWLGLLSQEGVVVNDDLYNLVQQLLKENEDFDLFEERKRIFKLQTQRVQQQLQTQQGNGPIVNTELQLDLSMEEGRKDNMFSVLPKRGKTVGNGENKRIKKNKEEYDYTKKISKEELFMMKRFNYFRDKLQYSLPKMAKEDKVFLTTAFGFIKSGGESR